MSAPYRLAAPADAIARALHADRAGDVWPGGDVARGGYAPVVIRDDARRPIMAPRQWGVPPPQSHSLRIEHTITHVRNLDSPFWIGTLRHTQFRCLVPMTHCWRAKWMAVPGAPIFACAGIWRDSEVPSFAILSTGEGLPLVLHPDDHRAWLGDDWKQARPMVERAASCSPLRALP